MTQRRSLKDMHRSSSLRSTTRESHLDVDAYDAWMVAASGQAGPHWYDAALPFVVRGALDRLVGGEGARWAAPGTALLATDDTVGFWRVTEADHDARRLVLTAAVRAPGRVTLRTSISPDASGCRLRQSVTLEPRGLLGAAYLLADLPAREAVLELAHRRLLRDLA